MTRTGCKYGFFSSGSAQSGTLLRTKRQVNMVAACLSLFFVVVFHRSAAVTGD